jgi:GNAT superfamily N-acetyltransferase
MMKLWVISLNSGEAQTEPQDYNALKFIIYVLQTYHGKNIGQQLLDFALQMGHHKASYIFRVRKIIEH